MYYSGLLLKSDISDKKQKITPHLRKVGDLINDVGDDFKISKFRNEKKNVMLKFL